MSLVSLLARRRIAGVEPAPPGPSPTQPHYGPAELPRVVPDYTSSDDDWMNATGTFHYPGDAEELEDLLASGPVAAPDTLQPNDVIILQDGVNYNSTVPQQRIQAVVDETGVVYSSKSNPVWIVNSEAENRPAPGVRFTNDYLLETPHFRMFYSNVPALILDDVHVSGIQFVGIQMDAGSTESNYGICHCGPVSGSIYLDDSSYNSVNWLGGREWVSYDGHVYHSLQDSNLDHTPDSSPEWWAPMTEEDLPHQILFDRCSIRSKSHTNNSVVSLRVEAREIAIVCSDVWSEGGEGIPETKGILGVNNLGPGLVDNCRIAAPGIPLLMGGEVPSFGAIPTDYTVRRCLFYKDTRWNIDSDDTDEVERGSKNLFELKVGNRWLVEDCLFENDFGDTMSQYYSFLIKSDDQSGDFPGAEGLDITLRNSRFKNIHKGLLAVGTGEIQNTPLGRISIYHVYTDGLQSAVTEGSARHWQIQFASVAEHIHLEHITFLGAVEVDTRWMRLDAENIIPEGWVFRNSIITAGEYGINSSPNGASRGIEWFTGHGSSCDAIHAITDGNSYSETYYPVESFTLHPDRTDIVQDYEGGNFNPATSLIGTGYEGRTPGADVDMIVERTAHCASGDWN